MPRAPLRWLLLPWVLTSLAWPAAALAQEPSPAEVEEARFHYEQGMHAVNAERWDEAIYSFERAYAAVPRPLILFNLGGAQLEAGRLAEALESYRRFLEDAGSDVRPQYRREAEAAIERLEPRLPRLTLSVSGAEPGDEVRLDGEALATSDIGTEIRVSPGEHLAEVAREGDIVASERFELAEGASRRVSVTVPPPSSVAAPAAALEADPPDTAIEDEGGSILGSPWLWVAVVAVVGGGVIAGILLTRDDEPADPYMGNLPPGGFEL